MCGSCAKDVGDDAIGCDSCEVWVHATEMCSGLPQNLITAIDQYNGGGIQFICTKCRVDHTSGRGKSPSSATEPHVAETLSQLSQHIKGICSVIQELMSQVKQLSAQPKPVGHADHNPQSVLSHAAGPPGNPQAQPPHDYRAAIREEMRELREREKRSQSIIIKGLKANSAADFSVKFAQMTETHMGTRVELTDLINVTGHAHIYRAKISDESLRKMLLDRARHLRGTEHNSVFISRDLTWAQRTEL